MKILIKNVYLTEEYGFGKEKVNILVDGKKIAYVGLDNSNLFADRVIDGKGNLVIPAFYNAHCHSPMTLFRGYGDDLPLDKWLNTRIFPAEDKLTDESVYLGTMLAIAEMIRCGIVSFSDMYMFMDSEGRAVKDCGVKANLSRSVVSFDEDLDMTTDFRMKESEYLVQKWNGACDGKIKVDMSLHAEYTNVRKCVEYVAKYAKDNNLGMQIHLSETEKEHREGIERRGVTPARFFYDCGVFEVPTSAAHCVYVNDEDIELMSEKNVTVVHNPVSNLKLGSGFMPYDKIKKAGINIALGTDGAASNNQLDILREMQFASLIHKGVSRKADITSARDMIYAATKAGALSQGRFDCGRIEVGYAADLIIIDMSAPNNIPSYSFESSVCYSVKSNDIIFTMCDGCILYENGTYTSIDIDKIRHDFYVMLDKYFD